MLSAVAVRRRARFAIFSASALLAVLLSAGVLRASEDASAIEQRLANAAQYLSSDELEGRGIGTKGIDLAAQYIAEQFAAAGLTTDLYDGKPFQKFPHTSGAQLGGDNRLTLLGPPAHEGDPPKRLELSVGQDFTPLAFSGSATFDQPLVFVGYGISADKEKYDDYSGIDATGKMVVILRHEPQQSDPNSTFDGERDSRYAPLRRKVSNAVEHGAAGVIFCTDEVEIRKKLADLRKKWFDALDRLSDEHARFKENKDPTPAELDAQRAKIEQLAAEVDTWSKKLQAEIDPVLSLSAGGPGSSQRDFPVLHCRRAVLDQAVKAALGKDLAQLESEIDQGPTPQSRELTGWRATGKTDLKQTRLEVQNVVAVLEGEGERADEAIVLGAHYDHLGYGGFGSLEGRREAIHNGADDNASGVAVMIEVARQLAGREKLPRRVVFVAFTGEESGLLGSARYAENPLTPINKTVAMINLDMVGRLRDEKLSILGTGTSKAFDEILDKVPSDGLKLARLPVGAGPSDQLAFYTRQVPVLHFFTGTHREYHRASDDFETLNIAGMRQIARLVEEVIVALANRTERPQFVSMPAARMFASDGKRPYFGSVPDFSRDTGGYRLAEVIDGGPADKAGLRAGDVVIEFGGKKVAGLEEFTELLAGHKAGDKVQTTVRRGEETLSVEVTLEKR